MGERAPARPEPLRGVPAWRVRALADFWGAARVVCAGGGGDGAAGDSGGLRVRDAGEVGVRACMRFEWLGAGRWGWQAAPDFVVAAGFSAFDRLGAGGPATLGRVTLTEGAGVNRLARSGERRRGGRSRARVRASQAMDISRDGERLYPDRVHCFRAGGKRLVDGGSRLGRGRCGGWGSAARAAEGLVGHGRLVPRLLHGPGAGRVGGASGLRGWGCEQRLQCNQCMR